MKNNVAESYVVGMMLAIVGGFLDSYTYLSRGHVFANAQTGNIVLIGMRISEGQWHLGLYYLLPVLAFIIGIFIADVLKATFEKHKIVNWRQLVLMMEMVVIFIVAFIPNGETDMIANILISFVCSLQVEGFRRLNGNIYATTMCTGNIRSATERFHKYMISKDKELLVSSIEYFGIVAVFIVGAAIGSLIVTQYGNKSVLFTEIGLVAVFILMFSQKGLVFRKAEKKDEKFKEK